MTHQHSQMAQRWSRHSMLQIPIHRCQPVARMRRSSWFPPWRRQTPPLQHQHRVLGV